MKTTAAILVETGKPLVIDEIEIPPLQPGQLLVEVKVSGVCHTQLLEARGHRGPDPFLPHCLGHEATGIVAEVSPGVSRFQSGDRVVLSWIKGAGADVPGTKYAWGSKTVNAGGITTFSRLTIVSENRVTKLDDRISFLEGALLGCAVPTGFGAVFNTAKARPGQSLLVVGCGGIGLCVISAARLAGCYPIIGVDINAAKLDCARECGADVVINSSQEDLVAVVNRVVRGGVDIALDATGARAVIERLLALVRNQGGAAIVIGNARNGELVQIDPKQLNAGKQIRGTWGGDNEPTIDFPRYQALMAARRISLGHMITSTYPLDQINLALDHLENGSAVRPLIICNE